MQIGEGSIDTHSDPPKSARVVSTFQVQCLSCRPCAVPDKRVNMMGGRTGAGQVRVGQVGQVGSAAYRVPSAGSALILRLATRSFDAENSHVASLWVGGLASRGCATSMFTAVAHDPILGY